MRIRNNEGKEGNIDGITQYLFQKLKSGLVSF
jgi:hypothetical protein